MHPLVHYFLHQNVIPKASNAAFRASQSQDTLSTVMAVDCSHVVREGDNTDEYFDEVNCSSLYIHVWFYLTLLVVDSFFMILLKKVKFSQDTVQK